MTVVSLISRLVASAVVVLSLAAMPAHAVKIEQVTTPSGIQAWLVHDPSLPIISMEAAFRGGSSLDPADRAGLAYMVSSLLDEGAGPYDSLTFQTLLESKAIRIGFDASKDSFAVSLKTLKENSTEAFDLLGIALKDPHFSSPDVERIRSQIQASLMRDAQAPASVAMRTWLAHVYPNHPYGIPTKGDVETVAAITPDDLKSYVAGAFARDRLMVAVVGDVTAQELPALLDAAFGSLPATTPASSTLAALKAPVPNFDGGVTVIERDNPQSAAAFGAPGLMRNDPDWYAAYTLNYILGGGGFSSRLTEEVREKRGLSYSVYTSLQPLMQAGSIVGSVSSRNDRIKGALDVIRTEWKRMRDKGPTAKELADAKTYLIGSFPLQMSSTDDLASILLSAQVYDLGIDFLERRNERILKVNSDDMKRVARRLLDPATLTTVVVGKPQGMKTQAGPAPQAAKSDKKK